MIPFGTPVITANDIQFVTNILRSGWIRSGGVVKNFEDDVAKFLGVNHAVATSSGSSALDAVFAAMEIEPGDEVIVPAMTYIAPVASAVRSSAKVILADIDIATGAIDPRCVAKLITNKTKLIVAVDYAGIPADCDALRKIAGGDVPILEDGAEGLGGKLRDGRKVCALGDVGIISFHAIKQVTCGEGGMLVTNNFYWADRARRIRNQGEGEEKYRHVLVGNNYRMTDYTAALGRSQFMRIEEKIRIRKELEEEYAHQLPGCGMFHYADATPCLFFFPVLVNNRDNIVAALRKKGVEIRLGFEPVYRQPAYEHRVSYNIGEMEQTEFFWSHIVSLPLHEKLTKEDIRYIANIIKESGGTGIYG